MNVKKIAFIGGDMRQIYAAELIGESGYECTVCGFDKLTSIPENITRVDSVSDSVENAECIILPLPASADKLSVNTPYGSQEIYMVSLISLLKEDQWLMGGMLDMRFTELHKKTYDYYTNEELKMFNAVPTAEGALAIAMTELPFTLDGADVSILGFGRIGKALAFRLVMLGAKVTVYARKESDIALAKIIGMEGKQFSSLTDSIINTSCVFNTVPEVILTSDILEKMNKNTLIIDLAGFPGGIEHKFAEKLGIRSIWAQGLPGKMSPVTAGKIIGKTILKRLENN